MPTISNIIIAIQIFDCREEEELRILIEIVSNESSKQMAPHFVKLYFRLVKELQFLELLELIQKEGHCIQE